MKVIWAYNPFFENQKLNIIGSEIIKNYFTADSVEVDYISSNSESELAYAYNISLQYRYTLYPKKIIKSQLQKLKLKNLKIEVIPSMTLSLTKAVTALVKHSKDLNADLIMMATNSKKTLPVFIFGSFAETLIHLSSSDLLTYHQKTKFLSKCPKKIIYAHDYTSKGTLGLLKIITYAKKWDATLHVVHIPMPEPAETDEEYIQNVEHKTKKAELLLQKSKIKYEILNLFDDSQIDQILLNWAKKKKMDLIAMTAQSSKLQVLLGGSVTRKVLRKAKKPVLVLKV